MSMFKNLRPRPPSTSLMATVMHSRRPFRPTANGRDFSELDQDEDIGENIIVAQPGRKLSTNLQSPKKRGMGYFVPLPDSDTLVVGTKRPVPDDGDKDTTKIRKVGFPVDYNPALTCLENDDDCIILATAKPVDIIERKTPVPSPSFRTKSILRLPVRPVFIEISDSENDEDQPTSVAATSRSAIFGFQPRIKTDTTPLAQRDRHHPAPRDDLSNMSQRSEQRKSAQTAAMQKEQPRNDSVIIDVADDPLSTDLSLSEVMRATKEARRHFKDVHGREEARDEAVAQHQHPQYAQQQPQGGRPGQQDHPPLVCLGPAEVSPRLHEDTVQQLSLSEPSSNMPLDSTLKAPSPPQTLSAAEDARQARIEAMQERNARNSRNVISEARGSVFSDTGQSPCSTSGPVSLNSLPGQAAISKTLPSLHSAVKVSESRASSEFTQPGFICGTSSRVERTAVDQRLQLSAIERRQGFCDSKISPAQTPSSVLGTWSRGLDERSYGSEVRRVIAPDIHLIQWRAQHATWESIAAKLKDRFGIRRSSTMLPRRYRNLMGLLEGANLPQELLDRAATSDTVALQAINDAIRHRLQTYEQVANSGRLVVQRQGRPMRKEVTTAPAIPTAVAKTTCRLLSPDWTSTHTEEERLTTGGKSVQRMYDYLMRHWAEPDDEIEEHSEPEAAQDQSADNIPTHVYIYQPQRRELSTANAEEHNVDLADMQWLDVGSPHFDLGKANREAHLQAVVAQDRDLQLALVNSSTLTHTNDEGLFSAHHTCESGTVEVRVERRLRAIPPGEQVDLRDVQMANPRMYKIIERTTTYTKSAEVDLFGDAEPLVREHSVDNLVWPDLGLANHAAIEHVIKLEIKVMQNLTVWGLKKKARREELEKLLEEEGEGARLCVEVRVESGRAEEVKRQVLVEETRVAGPRNFLL